MLFYNYWPNAQGSLNLTPGTRHLTPAMFDVISIGSCMVELTPAKPGLPLAQAGPLQMFPSGAATNFAFAAARLGLRVALISRVGKDELGDFMVNSLRERGIDTSCVRSSAGQHTSLCLCWADGTGKKYFYHYRFPGFSSPLGELSAEEVPESFLAQGKLLHFSEACVREPGVREAVFQIADRLRAQGGLVLYCPNYRGLWRGGEEEMKTVQRRAVGLADLLILNEEEAQIITGGPVEDAGPLLRQWGPAAVVITCGQRGAFLFSEKESEFVPAYPVPVVYDVGAGDTFQAGFVAGLSGGKTYAESVRLGAAAAALRISRTGDPANMPSAEEVRALLSAKCP